jgi:phage-related protein
MAGQSRTLKLSILADVDQLKKSLNTGSTEVQGFGNKISDFGKKAGLAFAAAGAAAAAYAGKLLIDGVKSAIADEAAQTKLATTLENVTGATNAQIKAVEQQILKTALLTGKTDDELRPSLDRLLRSTKNVEEAQRLQAIALDISAGSGKSLEAVSNALAKAAEGQNTALGKLGVGISAAELKTMSFEEITAKLAGTFEGQASKQADTFQGKMARLSVAFDEAKETVGSYVLDALTPLISNFVDKGIPAITDFASNLSKTLGPAFTTIFKVIKEDLLPILTSWWRFLYDEIIPAISSIVGPILAGLKSAFDKIKTALSENSAELEPFYQALAKVWDFIKKYLAPLLGGTFKLALEAIGSIVAGLVSSFSKLVGFISGTINKLKEFVEFIKDNPITNFFFGGDNSKGLKAGGTIIDTTKKPTLFPITPEDETGPPVVVTSKFGGTRDISGLSPAQQAAVLRSIELQAETERLRRQRAGNTKSLTTGITVNVNGAIDPEGTARVIVDTLNNSFYRGTGGATGLVTI